MDLIGAAPAVRSITDEPSLLARGRIAGSSLDFGSRDASS
jgi:hypothetical protein